MAGHATCQWLAHVGTQSFSRTQPYTSNAQANKSFFSEIIASISDITFSRDGRYILSRDYMTLKLWDLAKENAPVATYNVHEHLRARVRAAAGVVCTLGAMRKCAGELNQHKEGSERRRGARVSAAAGQQSILNKPY